MAHVAKYDNHEIEVKRFYLPEGEFTMFCPCCDKYVYIDLSGKYLSYPTIGAKEPLYFLCPHCEEGLEVDVELEMSLTIHDEKPRKQ